MAWVLQFEFETWCSLQSDSLIFEFRDRRFKYLRGNEMDRDCLLTLPEGSSRSALRAAQRDSMLFLACLAWEHHTPFVPKFGGGGPGADSIDQVERIQYGGRSWLPMPRQLDLQHLPYPESHHHEIALGLYREAMASESEFYRFLCLWNILSIPGRATREISEWIDKTLSERPGEFISREAAEKTRQQHGSLGKYLVEDCRHAVAHVLRDSPSRTPLDPNSWDDLHRISEAAGFLQDFVPIYVREHLQLTKRICLTDTGTTHRVYRQDARQ